MWTGAQVLITQAEWFRVYDIVEAIAKHLETPSCDACRDFHDRINDCFRGMGTGWQLRDGRIQARGEEAHEWLLAQSRHDLKAADMPTAESELREAIDDLSKRPESDLSGAVHHAMAALECVAKRLTDEPKRTLGDIIKCYRHRFPRPLDEVIEKAWGYASEHARHGNEVRELTRPEAQLIVALASTMSTYLLEKTREDEN